MRVVLQNRNSFLYFQQPDQWTAEANQATNFEHIQSAREFARRTKLPNLDAVMIYGISQQYRLRVPVSP